MIDQLFGTPGLYTYTHRFFEESLASYYNPPSTLIGQRDREPDECTTLWYNHMGGFEGLRQKGWTLITIAMLLLVEHRVGFKSYIVGGDNQVCRVHIPKIESTLDNEYLKIYGKEVNTQITAYADTLSEISQEVGLVIKKEETWISSIYLIYGKEMLIHGAYTPQACKRIARTLMSMRFIQP
jgi:hypothetical protein